MITGNKLTLNFTAAGSQQLAGPNPNRVGLILSAPGSSTIFLNFGDQSLLSDGLRFNSGAVAPWILQFDRPNDLITQAIWINSQAATLVFGLELVDRAP